MEEGSFEYYVYNGIDEKNLTYIRDDSDIINYSFIDFPSKKKAEKNS
jgi:hypothetical protein